MKKKFMIVLLAVACAAVCASGLAACGNTDGDDPIAVSGVTLGKTELTLDVGGEETLTATVTPDDADDKSVTWSVSSAGIVEVDGGKVTAIAAGTATVTATAGGKSASCTVTVNEAVTYTVTEEEWNDAVNWRYKNLTYEFEILSDNDASSGMTVQLTEDGSLHQSAGMGWNEHIYKVNGDGTVSFYMCRNGEWEEGMGYDTVAEYEAAAYGDDIGIIDMIPSNFVYGSFVYDETSVSYKGTADFMGTELTAEVKFENKNLVYIDFGGSAIIELYDYGTTEIVLPEAFL